MQEHKDRHETSKRTLDDIRTIAQALDVSDLSDLNLPQIEAMLHMADRISPAGNARRVIFSGLAYLRERYAPATDAKSDTNFLFRSLEKVVDGAVYSTFFAGPATVIWFYQNLLKLSGKNPEDYFPEGYWQFYIEYALREDTARHTHETHGFDTVLGRHRLQLSRVDRMTAWVMAAVHCLHQYDALLRNEWRERVYTHALRAVTADRQDAVYFKKLYREWERKRPYRRGPDVRAGQDYATYRRIKFDQFLEQEMRPLSRAARRRWLDAVQTAKREALPAYQKQMSILAHLKSGAYGEERVPIDIGAAYIGVIYKRQYYLIPVCRPGTREPADITAVRSQVAMLVANAKHQVEKTELAGWARVKRAHVPTLEQQMRPDVLDTLRMLHHTPILINMDQRPAHLDLSEIRQAERGIGAHAMTIFDTGETFIFDQSHIFFDGTWGAALAEIVTNEATAWGVYLNTLPPIHSPTAPLKRLQITFNPAERAAIEAAPAVPAEVSAETEAINLRNLLALRRVFKLRNDLIQLTVNDLLVLYRAIHAFTYRPSADLLAGIEALFQQAEGAKETEVAEMVLKALDQQNVSNPSILIPVDASQHKPSDRLHPISFQVPIRELDLLSLHQHVVIALNDYKLATVDRDAAYQRFDELQRRYLAALAGCGAVFARAKEIAAKGESTSVGTIKLLAGLPVALQRLLDKIPSRFELLNDIIKGREVFSNIGAVASSSSLLRFMSAKDDNEDKTLAWGVLTDAEAIMRVTLRDFRPHVTALHAIGRGDVAKQITQDYLNAYAAGLNDYVRDLRRITMASRETRLVSDIGMLDARDSGG